MTPRIALLALMLGGCSLTADPTMTVKQANDLTDPDTDGVINAREQCPQTQLGSLVNNYGCPSTAAQQQLQDLYVLFEHDKSEVRPEFMDSIQQTAQFMLNNPDQMLTIEGHASTPGTDDYNVALSQRRADAVKQIMVEEFGVPAERIVARPYGEANPSISKEDEQAYTANRRAVGTLHTSTHETVAKWNVYSVENGYY